MTHTHHPTACAAFTQRVVQANKGHAGLLLQDMLVVVYPLLAEVLATALTLSNLRGAISLSLMVAKYCYGHRNESAVGKASTVAYTFLHLNI